ncbi:MAG TPA: sulfite exporter TauE/SafE family protein [Azospirillaceae bacterium]|nr:sulfite exporter TauE/SafE family protein [Azospirillaceae bacterium]
MIDLSSCMAAIDGAKGLISALFMAGLVGGFGHCAPMCGPFVLAQAGRPGAAGPGASGPVLTRVRGALLLPYHAGRMLTYGALGAVVGGMSGLVVAATGFRWLLAAALAVAALLFLRQGLRGLSPWLPAWMMPSAPGGGGPSGSAMLMARLLRPLLSRPGGPGGFALGVALGFLPCGFLYAALASAVGSGGAVEGFAAMAAFALGTMPSLLMVGFAGTAAAAAWRQAVRVAAPALMLVNAGVLTMMAWHTMVG